MLAMLFFGGGCSFSFYSPFTNRSRLDLHATSSARHIHKAILWVEKACAPTAAAQIQSKVSSSRLHNMNLRLGTSAHNLSSDKPRGRPPIGRDGGCLHNLCGNAPTCRSAGALLHKIYQERERRWMKPGKTGWEEKKKRAVVVKNRQGEGQDSNSDKRHPPAPDSTQEFSPMQMCFQPRGTFTLQGIPLRIDGSHRAYKMTCGELYSCKFVMLVNMSSLGDFVHKWLNSTCHFRPLSLNVRGVRMWNLPHHNYFINYSPFSQMNSSVLGRIKVIQRQTLTVIMQKPKIRFFNTRLVIINILSSAVATAFYPNNINASAVSR